jgi:hypothetical protein
MTTARVGHEDAFIAHVTGTDNMPGKYYFNFNDKLVANNSDTKRITV